jgi:phosphatidylserine decarboxylase
MSLFISSLRLVPKNALSYAVGSVLRVPWPRPLVRAAIGGFASRYGVLADEAERDLGTYRTFGEFFTRRLKPDARPIAADPAVLCCPVDGAAGVLGTITGGTLIQAKGRTYPLKDFVVDPEDAARFEGGTYATLYLAPGNYHRIHFPLAGKVTGYAYVPGHLWPVNKYGVSEIDRLFAVNERLITYEETAAGMIAIVKVGATCVGRIRLSYDDIVTNDAKRPYARVKFDEPFQVEKGGECGVFEMGSTVILLFEPGRVELDAGLTPGTPVRMGQPLGRWSKI